MIRKTNDWQAECAKFMENLADNESHEADLKFKAQLQKGTKQMDDQRARIEKLEAEILEIEDTLDLYASVEQH